METARVNNVKKVIFISSGGAIYGEAEEYPTSEVTQPEPLSPYAVTKTVSEQYLAFYRHHYGLDYTVLRYANVYGPRQIPHGEAGVVAIFMDRLLNNKPCTVFHYEDETKGMTRDYCFVGDIVQANMAAIEKGSCDAFNIGTTVATHTLDLYYEIFAAVGEVKVDLNDSLSEPLKSKARPGDLTQSCLNVEKAKIILGFSPEYDLKEGLKKTLQWRLTLDK